MISIVSYQKVVTPLTTVTLALPFDAETRQFVGTEVANIEGTTYVSIPSGYTLPDQPTEIAASVKVVKMTPELRSLLNKNSPQCTAIDKGVVEKISAAYTTSDEIKLLRLGPSADFDTYNTYVENCRQWGRDQKAALGL